ncbi:hypothetical protein N7462_006817 [Penicillium macrosclerotiorum]|uniref:uncharacterized protein n=1 Tax=Penicillium macrosclerotiorum TaxID=303699 RepID=UPI002547CD73|nr:uncharacterized protein N7462_006817 [Penicillium macrosclerotiorum]KAJ5683652.1 hypothetical protein N7462_006817 [Penicillium macrosclerotiorum]
MAQDEKGRHKRPRTIWLDEEAFSRENPALESLDSHDRSSQLPQSDTGGSTSSSAQSQIIQSRALIRQTDLDPWEAFEPIAEITRVHSLLLARRKNHKGRLVHIQQTKQHSSAKSTLDTTNILSHPSFLGLLEFYQHNGLYSLIWEPTEVTLSQILASKCEITTEEIIAIVKPRTNSRKTLEGIQYLFTKGWVLATLTSDTIFVTYSGRVKIGGVENSCQIMSDEMNPATWKAYALADIVTQLIGRNGSYKGKVDISSLPDHLRTLSVDEILQNPIFACALDPGELKLLVNLANKTAYHRVDSYSTRV